uniref:Uncharacterized protein n=1 Tax=Peronospora matthiolae TaxID=2874970 RepID=A0AAV1T915_9STRA
MALGVSSKSHSSLLKDVSSFRETFGQTQHALNEAQPHLETLEGDHARLQTMETRLTRLEAQLDLLIRIQNLMATPLYAAQAPSSQQGMDPGTA